MSDHFSRSFRSLEGESLRRHLVFLAVLTAGLAVWASWFIQARVATYAATSSAHLTVDRDNHPVDAPVAGRVVSAAAIIGQHVEEGDVLLVLETDVERLAQDEAQARLAPTGAQLASLRRQLEAEQRALAAERAGDSAAIAQDQARVDQATVLARLARDEASRQAVLKRSGLVSELEAIRASNLAEEREALARSASAAAQLASQVRQTQKEDRLARISNINASIASLQGTHDEAVATSARLGFEIQRRQIRAPVAGTLADVSTLRAGSVVKAGDHICSIVPAGTLKVLAQFSPSDAVGRVRIGQSARVRFVGFPWTQYGSAPAHVIAVASEVRDGAIQAELSLDPTPSSLIPLQHGLPAEVDVEVERLSPAAMVLRTIGRHLAVGSARTRI
jgi:membrane fusion protein (multidrug efflux system)